MNLSKLGTLLEVFTPLMVTILGVIVYVRRRLGGRKRGDPADSDKRMSIQRNHSDNSPVAIGTGYVAWRVAGEPNISFSVA